MSPHDIPENDLPLAVLSDFSSGLLEFLIKWRTKSLWNHIMWMRRPGMFASQGNTYSEVDVSRYMRKGNRLKFIRVHGLTLVQKELIKASIQRKLDLPWWKKMYDHIGIFGQAIGIKSINVNGLNYCSEDFIVHGVPVIDVISQDQEVDGIKGSRLIDVLSQLPVHGSPEDINYYFNLYPDIFEVYLEWSSDHEKNVEKFNLLSFFIPNFGLC